jgi:hypothetical protein
VNQNSSLSEVENFLLHEQEEDNVYQNIDIGSDTYRSSSEKVLHEEQTT